ncbi:MAG: radical SAM protein [Dehalococcoidia bacterium]|jgi:radical SAM superfamily enzyme YgiQ (UPF0313 family)
MKPKALLACYDNGSHLPFFPTNLAYLYSALDRAGWHVEVWHQDIHHYPDRDLTKKVEEGFDLVGLGFVAGYYQHAKAVSLSKAINNACNRNSFKFVLGGHGPAASPKYFLNKLGADHVVIGDGEEAILNLTAPIVQGGRCKPDFWPAYSEFPMEIYRLHRFPNSDPSAFTVPLLSARGCFYNCSFCARIVKGFCPREAKDVLEELTWLHYHYGVRDFQFSDELLMSSESRAVEFSEAIMALRFKIKWDCNGRLNYADPEVLQIMKKSGCNYVNYGVEALDDEVLRLMNKKLTVETINKGVEATIDAGLTPGLNIMWGNPGDDAETLRRAVDFLLKYDGVSELRTIRPVTPYPGSALFDLAVERGMIEDAADFYERKHTNSDLFTVSFMPDISPKEADLMLWKANERLISAYYMRCTMAASGRARAFYTGQDATFRGWRAA